VLESLHRRRRGRRLARRLRLGGVGAELAERRPPDYDDALQAPSRTLFERLDAADVAEVVRRLTPDERSVWDGTTEAGRARLALTLGTHHRVPAVLEKAGLTPEMPPDDVHSMVRSPIVTGGDPWLADLVIGAAGDPEDGAAALDFGCSSGRVVRLLAAWRPDVRWLGCDPNAGAIAWAQEHLPGVEWFAGPQHPPLPLDAGSLRLVYAISIWSHFGEGAALRWLDEVHRLLAPGGALVFTAHGLGSIGDFVRRGMLRARDGSTAAAALATRGHWFRSTFAAGGDWGVEDPEWGHSYMSPEWVLRNIQPRWQLRRFEPARLDGNQDLYVLQKGSDPLSRGD
jgi:SAM-dependent methyltransferase